ncbi:MAG: 23S rRNA (adenine(2503)-C(2))-methyltransferase RlmN [Caldisericota bacterium]|nr:23S rRNA (adenine(2503)-C(2))-methyltransferase RlmN [Caldisericota bacterium]
MKKDIKNLNLDELKEYFLSIHEPEYRANELFHSIYREKKESFHDITTLPKSLRKTLTNTFYIYSFKIISKYESKDGSTKYLFQLPDKSLVETVFMHESNQYGKMRNTLCISSSIGCPLGCKFCATGQMGLLRNMTTEEIVEQFLQIDKITKINNVVFMGMGEPLLNYDNVKKAIEIISDKNGRTLGRRKIVISTSGIPGKIYQLTDQIASIRLAISLHAGEQSKRDFLMPGLKEYTLTELRKAINYYTRKTGNTITIEYLLLKEVNDTISDVQSLVNFLKKLKFVKVNLIRYNPVPHVKFKVSKKENMFLRYLQKNSIRATLRKSKGPDISAACGQLATKLRK